MYIMNYLPRCFEQNALRKFESTMQDISTQKYLSAQKCMVHICSCQSIVLHTYTMSTYVFCLETRLLFRQVNIGFAYVQAYPDLTSFVDIFTSCALTVVGRMSHLAWCNVVYGAVVMWCFLSGLCNAV